MVPPQAYKKNPGPNSKFPLSELLAGADELLAEIGTLPDRPNHECIGFYLSFFPYMVGSAHAYAILSQTSRNIMDVNLHLQVAWFLLSPHRLESREETRPYGGGQRPLRHRGVGV